MTDRIAWATPWNARSAIAEFSVHVVAELKRRGHEVTILRTETGASLELDDLPFDGTVEKLETMSISSLGWTFDHIVGNVGDNFAFHGALPRVMDELPILGLFHDGLIAHLADPWARSMGDFPDGSRILADVIYDRALPDAVPFWLPLAEMADRRPMLEWLAGTVAGAFTHSDYWSARLRNATPGKVTTHPLTMPDHLMPPPPAWSGRVVIATIGHVNQNKRADQILSAIASDPVLRSLCEYRLLGHVEEGERARLSRLARLLGLDQPLFTGWIEIEELRRQVADVHVLSCLRHPIFETGSASLILAMRSGRPVLVSNEGVYGDVDDEAVLKCTPGNEAPDIARHLLSLMRNPQQQDTIAQSAISYVERANSLISYVDALEGAMKAASANAPRITMLRSFGRSLGAMGVASSDAVCDRLAYGLDGMFAKTAALDILIEGSSS